jgi:hypothetical protein
MASASWHDGVMLGAGRVEGQPAMAGCCALRQRLGPERPSDVGIDGVWELAGGWLVNSVPPDDLESQSSARQVSRKALCDEVWRRPMLRAAERYGVFVVFHGEGLACALTCAVPLMHIRVDCGGMGQARKWQAKSSW